MSCAWWGRERKVYHSRVPNESAVELAAELRNPDSSFTPSMRLSTALQVSDITANQVIHPFESAYARMRHVQVLVPFMTHSDSNSDVFHGVHHRNFNSCVFCLVHCNDSHSNACHASITVTTSKVLHPVLPQWLMLMHCTSLWGISIMHHFKITLYSTGCSN